MTSRRKRVFLDPRRVEGWQPEEDDAIESCVVVDAMSLFSGNTVHLVNDHL